jgi:hypothetical protein
MGDERGGAFGAKQQLLLAGKRGRRRRENTREGFISLNTQGGGVIIESSSAHYRQCRVPLAIASVTS